MLSEIPWRNRICIILSSTFAASLSLGHCSEWMWLSRFSLLCFCLLCLYRFVDWLVGFKWISLLLHTQYMQKSSLWKNIHVIIIKVIWTKVIRLYLLYLKPVVFTFLSPIISFHLKYHICAVDTNQINFFLVIKHLLYPFPCSISAEKIKWEYAAYIISYMGEKLLSYGRSWSSSSRHIVGFRMWTAVSLKRNYSSDCKIHESILLNFTFIF